MKKESQKSDVICLECANSFSIMRKKGNLKPIGYIEEMFCPSCMKATDFIEIGDLSLFKKKVEFATYISKKDQDIYNLICQGEEKQIQR